MLEMVNAERDKEDILKVIEKNKLLPWGSGERLIEEVCFVQSVFESLSYIYINNLQTWTRITSDIIRTRGKVFIVRFG